MKSSGIKNLVKRLTKNNVFTVPNFMSLFRLLLIPVIANSFFNLSRYMTIGLICLSAITDVADGYIARHFNMMSDIGKILDPIADKLTLAAIAVCLAIKNKSIIWLLILMSIKEIVLIALGYISLRFYDSISSSKWYGKVCTAVLYASFAAYILFPNLSALIKNIIFFVCLFAVAASVVLYINMYIGIWRKSGKHQEIFKSNSVGKATLILTWLAIIILCIIGKDKFSAEGISGIAPSDTILAVLFILSLFALKSLSVFIYSGILFAASGLIFPWYIAIPVSIVGTVIMASLPYFIAKISSEASVQKLTAQYPKLETFKDKCLISPFSSITLIRTLPAIPYDIVSSYCGAVGMPFVPYLFGSVIGILPNAILTTILGNSVYDIKSPEFVIALCARIIIFAVSVIKTVRTNSGKEEKNL